MCQQGHGIRHHVMMLKEGGRGDLPFTAGKVAVNAAQPLHSSQSTPLTIWTICGRFEELPGVA